MNAFPPASDPFGSSRSDDPFASATVPTANAFEQKLDDADPFRPVDFNAAQEMLKKSISNRSKTPGANMFGGSDFAAFPAPAATNRPQSAMPWEPSRSAPPAPGSQALHDLFDVFG